MLKFCCKLIVLSSLFCSPWLYAQTETDEQDEYNQCVDQTIKEMQLESINNMVVHSCSEQAKKTYEEKIVALIDQIRAQSEEYKQPERYQDILKSQRLWKAYVDQECNNAGSYIGSPMYSYCPRLCCTNLSVKAFSAI
ncbi:lysozyme inhibitor LprI family protein [Acinetobacter baumannii]|uniref:lysozyme inhibitor LprI family protein n=1 Tax=Acinetobacter baumannii TaxID=470 RepID=UPI0038918388